MIQTIAKIALRLAGKSMQKKSTYITGSLEYLERKRKIKSNYFDYIRLSTLELVSNRLNSNNIQGSVAEVGVYKGSFACLINEYFPGRKLYLFDTFEGFDNRDVNIDHQNKFSSDKVQDFSNTSVEDVLKIMPFRDVCVVKKGYFPETAAGLNDTFAFVSLDTDLYAPIYEGLNFFYPRLAKGGYIFIHDFNNDCYKGAKKAVEQFCAEQEISFVPIADICGTCIITK